MNTDLRTRYRMRQQRIAAGLPAPQPVTMTAVFFASNPVAAEKPKCSECGEEFMKHGRQVVCGPGCYKERERRLKRGAELTVMCDECKRQFTTTNSRAVVCGDECRQVRNRRYQREWQKERYDEQRGRVA